MSVFYFIMVLVPKGFLNSVFVTSPWKKSPTSHFYSSRYVENRKKKTISYMYSDGVVFFQ